MWDIVTLCNVEYILLGVYILTQPSYFCKKNHQKQWVFTCGPSSQRGPALCIPVAAPSTFTSSLIHSSQKIAYKTLDHFVCSWSFTIIINKSNIRCSMGVYTLTQPSCCIPHHQKKVKIERESLRFRLVAITLHQFCILIVSIILMLKLWTWPNKPKLINLKRSCSWAFATNGLYLKRRTLYSTPLSNHFDEEILILEYYNTVYCGIK